MMKYPVVVLLASVALSAACIESSTVVCSNGNTCPADNVCTATGGCASPTQIEGCNGKAELEACSYPGIANGACYDGVCLLVGCGNATIEAPEVCDDGNTLAGDGCSATCLSDESCGNGITDATKGEACDCGSVSGGDLPPGCSGPNADGPGATCHLDCTLVGCGDAVATTPEDCDAADLRGAVCTDLGWYGGALACSPLCRFDETSCIGRCGNGVVDGPAGVEACDGAPVATETCTDFGWDAGRLDCSSFCAPTFSGCKHIGWQRLPTLPFVAFALWATDTHVWAAGSGGRLAVHDGAQWTFLTEQSPLRQLSGIWGGGPDDVFSVGSEGVGGVILHWNGQLLTTTAAPFALTDVHGTGLDDIYAAGTEGVLHSTGGAFSSIGVLADFGGERPLDVWAIGPNDAIAVGTKGAFRWNGATWSPMGSAPSLSEVVVRSATDITAVGPTGTIAHWNGSAWSFERSPTTDNLTSLAIVGDSMIAAGWTTSLLWNDARSWFALDMENATGPVTALHASGSNRVVATTGQIVRVMDAGAWEQLTPVGRPSLLGIHGSSVADVWGVGVAGAIVHWDGWTWRTTVSPTRSTLRAVFARTATDAWAVGDNVIARWNGTTWSVMAAPAEIAFRAVWAFAENDAFIAGDNGLIYRWNGTTWNPLTSGTTASLNDLWGTSPTHLIAVGNGGTILAWNGSTWTPEPIAPTTTADLVGISGVSATDIWAVGANTAVHFFAGTWTSAAVPSTGFQDVWALSATSVLAVAVDPVSGVGTLHMHNGSSWSVQASAPSGRHRVVWGLTASASWIGGDNLEILAFNTADVGYHPAAAFESTGTAALTTVWASSVDDVYITAGTGLARDAALYHHDGTILSRHASSSVVLTAVWGSASNDVYLGDSSTVRHFDGTTEVTEISMATNALWGSGPADVYAVGPGGGIRHKTAAGWADESVATSLSFLAISGSGPGEVVAVGFSGLVARRRAGAWTMETVDPTYVLNGVWVGSATDAWAVGYGGVILHWNGTTWTKQIIGSSSEAFLAIGGTGPNDLFAVGSSVYHYDGVLWSPVRMPTTINGVWRGVGTVGKSVFIVGESLVVRLVRPSPW